MNVKECYIGKALCDNINDRKEYILSYRWNCIRARGRWERRGDGKAIWAFFYPDGDNNNPKLVVRPKIDYLSDVFSLFMSSQHFFWHFVHINIST